MEKIISNLKAHGVSVETSKVFLLDLTDVQYEVPQSLDGFPVRMNYIGSVPPWADRLRYHLHVCFHGERHWSVYERPNGFNVQVIVSRILKQLAGLKRARAERDQADRDKALAEERFAKLSEAIGAVQDGLLRLTQDNLKIEGVPEAPNEVYITVRTSHANAEKIAREYRASARRARKP